MLALFVFSESEESRWIQAGVLAAILARFLAFDRGGLARPSPLRHAPYVGAALFSVCAIAAGVIIAAGIRLPLVIDRGEHGSLDTDRHRTGLEVGISNAGPSDVRITSVSGSGVRGLYNPGSHLIESGATSYFSLRADCRSLTIGAPLVVTVDFEAGGHRRSQPLQLPAPSGRCR